MDKIIIKRLGLILLTYFFMAGCPGTLSTVYAQSRTDAGVLMKQVDDGRKKIQKDKELPPALPQVTSTEASDKTQVKITVKHFRFKGNSILKDRDLEAAVRSFLGRPITYSQLQDAAAAVGEAYRKKGWVVRAFLPQQEIANGIVEIDVVEAKFGKVLLEKDSYSWPSLAKINAIFNAAKNEGRPFNVEKLERPLLILDGLPGVTATGRLQPGQRDGETDLVLSTSKEPLVSGMVLADNEGSRATSEYRLHQFVQLQNPFKTGDLTSVYLLESEGMRYARFEETLPVGDSGWRIGANASMSDYEILTSEFEALDADGRSNSLGASASYPLIRSRLQNLDFNVNYDHKFFYNRAAEDVSSKYEIDRGSVGLRGNRTDSLWGGGNSYADLSFIVGTLDLGTINTGEDRSLHGDFHKLMYNVSRQQNLLPRLAFYGEVSGQTTPLRRLDSAEKFYLGGPDGVRAFPVSEGSGVQGVLYKGELQWKLAPGYRLSGFYDYGSVWNYGGLPSYSLDGAGLEGLWQSRSGVSVKLTWAHRLQGNPNETAGGNDQDGSLRKDRFWLKISFHF